MFCDIEITVFDHPHTLQTYVRSVKVNSVLRCPQREQGFDEGKNRFARSGVLPCNDVAEAIQRSSTYSEERRAWEEVSRMERGFYKRGIKEGYEKGSQEGYEKDTQEGREEGREDLVSEIVLRLFQQGRSPEDIVTLTGFPIEQVKRITASLPP